MSLSSSTTLSALAADVQKRLGDASSNIWLRSELEDYLIEGNRILVTQTDMLWGITVLPDWPGVFTFTAEWERAMMPAGWLVSGPGSITADWERDYLPNSGEARTITSYWEYYDGHATTVSVPALSALPSDVHTIERATWNNRRIDALRSRELEEGDARYEINTGTVEAYTRDKDGLNVLRKWRKPSTPYTPYRPTDTAGGGGGYFGDGFFGSGYYADGYFSGEGSGLTADTRWGIYRLTEDLSTEEAIGTWGILRQIPDQESTDQWGEARAFNDDKAVRIEYRRRPGALQPDSTFEIPPRYLKYLRYFAMARALERRGDGQNTTMAKHYADLWSSTLERISRRYAQTTPQRATVLRGSAPRRPRMRPSPQLPPAYGPVVRY